MSYNRFTTLQASMFNEAIFQEILLPSSGTLQDDGRSISRNVALLNILVHYLINLLLNIKRQTKIFLISYGLCYLIIVVLIII